MNISKRFFREAHHKTYDSFFKVSKAKKKEKTFKGIFKLLLQSDGVNLIILNVSNKRAKHPFQIRGMSQVPRDYSLKF